MPTFRRTAIRPLFQTQRTRPTGPRPSGHRADVQHGVRVLLGRLHGHVLWIHVLEHGAHESVINKHVPRLVEAAFSTRFLGGSVATGAHVVYESVEEADEDEDPEQRIRRRACVWVLRRGRNLQMASF